MMKVDAMAAQTASLADDHMMTYIPNPPSLSLKKEDATVEDMSFEESIDAYLGGAGDDASNSPIFFDRNNTTVGPTPVVSASTTTQHHAHAFPPTGQTATTVSSSNSSASAQHLQQQQQEVPLDMAMGGMPQQMLPQQPIAPSPNQVYSNPGVMTGQQPYFSALQQMYASPQFPVLSQQEPATMPTQASDGNARGQKRGISQVTPAAADGTVKRKSDRNQREQQRSQKITQQITELRSVLAAANVHFKPDKHSTLVSVVDYIKQLQRRSSLLNAEHQKLISTISKTGEVVNANQNNGDSVSTSLSTSSASQSMSSSNSSSKNSSSDQDADDHLVFVKGLDYKGIFNCCGIALGIASVDGRFLDCNDQFLSISGYCRDELLTVGSASNNINEMHLMESIPQASNTGNVPSIISKKNLSLFSLLGREDMERVFSVMSQMLKSLANEHKESCKPGKSTNTQSHSDVNADQWSGLVRLSRRKESPVRMNISLVRSTGGRPKFFNFALTPES
eukprot:scaffold231279_cov45-Attheya_sp.AAC.1